MNELMFNIFYLIGFATCLYFTLSLFEKIVIWIKRRIGIKREIGGMK